MQDDQQNQVGQQQAPSEQTAQPHDGILNQTFGEVLQSKEAQERIMKAMHVSPEQFQQLLKSTEGNPLTNMTVGQLFNSGFVQQAVQAQKTGNVEQAAQTIQDQQMMQEDPAPDGAGQMLEDNAEVAPEQLLGEGVGEEQELDPEQFQQMVESGNAQVLETDEMGNPTKIAVEQPRSQPELQKQSIWDMIKSVFK